MINMIGKVLGGRYEILEQIGSGGMAVVYKAVDRKLNRYIAVKVLRKEFADNQEFVKRFKIESQSVASLSHPNIVSVYDVGNEDNTQYIVMEYVKGKTLKKILEERAPLTEKEVLDISSQICSGLENAHKNHIIHRDIKPHNIMITYEGTVKITDFGIARDVNSTTFTSSGDIIGSVHYFSPEQAKGGHIDEKSDIYSLGVVMYEMATGRVPFDDQNAISIALKHLNEEPKKPNIINRNISDALNNIILKALNKNPFDRYQNVSLMLNDLRTAKYQPDGKFVNRINNSNPLNEATQIISSEEISKALNKAKNTDSEEPSDLEKGNTTKMTGVNDDMEGKKDKKKDKKKESRFDKTTKIAIATVIILIALISTGIYFLAKMFTVPGETRVPNVEGYSLATAKAELKGRKLQWRIAEVRNDDMYEKGVVIRQDPKEESVVRENSTVDLVVNGGIKKVKIPNVVSKDKSDARKILKRKGFTVQTILQYDDTVPKDAVIQQEPLAGKQVDPESTVSITISMGKKPEYVVVPQLVGLTQEEAIRSISDNKLSLGNIDIQADAAPKGTVINQSLQPDLNVKAGSPVSLVVSSGQTAVTPVTPTTPNNNTQNTTSGNNSSGNNNSSNSNSSSSSSNNNSTSGTTPNKSANTSASVSKNLVVQLPQNSQSDTINVRIEQQNSDGSTSEISNQGYDASQKNATIVVQGKKGTTQKYDVYVDDGDQEVKNEKTVKF